MQSILYKFERMNEALVDSFGRAISYLRLAVTDRCNLRCTYCMPKEGLNWLPRKELMTYEEMIRICSLFIEMGVTKIRITGGEPFVRRDLLPFLKTISEISGLQELTLTTNGLLTRRFVPELKQMGIRAVNLSLDTLDKNRFIQLTHRDELGNVLKTLDALLAHDIAVKINTVVMENQNIADIVPLVALTKSLPIRVRFIEEMPFHGGTHHISLNWNYIRIFEHIQAHFPMLVKIPAPPHATADQYQISGHQGDVGIIAAYTRSFCGACNRIRITPTGMLRTCLYGPGSLNIRDALRTGRTNQEIQKILTQAILKKPQDGWQAQAMLSNQTQSHASMATIGG